MVPVHTPNKQELSAHFLPFRACTICADAYTSVPCFDSRTRASAMTHLSPRKALPMPPACRWEPSAGLSGWVRRTRQLCRRSRKRSGSLSAISSRVPHDSARAPLGVVDRGRHRARHRRRAPRHGTAEVNELLFDARTCGSCGCTDHDACVDDEGWPCEWVEVDLCSACPDPMELLSLGRDPVDV